MQAATADVLGARVIGVAAGLHLLLELPGHDDTDLAVRLGEGGVVVDALSRHRSAPGPGGLVLGYAAHPPHQLRIAAAIIARTLREGASGRARASRGQ